MFNLNELKNVRVLNSLPFLFFLSFGLWVYIFQGYFAKELMLSSDGIPYLEHFKFYIDQISRGVYPLWEPDRNEGVPVEFFLRRIGSFNPTYILLIIFVKVGLYFQTAYVLFWSVYYFSGMIAFYLIAKRLWKDASLAFMAYLLLAFSSLGVRMFDSYILLVFVPMIWFFYFLIRFAQNPDKFSLVGMTLTLVVLMTTYLPFYFITILTVFLFCFVCFYPKSTGEILQKGWRFIKTNKLVVILCLLAVIISLIPGILLKAEASNAEVVVPLRSGIVQAEENVSVMQVYKENITRWGMLEEFIYSSLFLKHLKDFQFEVLYVPLFAFVLFLLGVFTRLNKRLFFLLTWGLILFLMGLPEITPLYDFLYKNLFYFKYIRNFHFLPWLVMLPVFVFFVVEQFSMVLKFFFKHERFEPFAFFAVSLVHVLLFYDVHTQMDPPSSSYWIVGLSFIFLNLILIGKIKPASPVFLWCVFIIIVIGPMQVFEYLTKSADLWHRRYRYERPYLTFSLPTKEAKAITLKNKDNLNIEKLQKKKVKTRRNMYFGSNWFNYLRENINDLVIQEYLLGRLILYDEVMPIDEKTFDPFKVAEVFMHNRNVAFVEKNYEEDFMVSDDLNKRPYPHIVEAGSPFIEVSGFDFNYVKLKTNFRHKKFLVMNYNYHSEWSAFIDGEKSKIQRANIAFMGLWVPAGEHVVYFRFGHWWRYALNYLLLGITYVSFFYLIILAVKNRKEASE